MGLASEKGADLAFDTEVIKSAALAYQTSAQELREMADRLVQLLEGMASAGGGWDTEGGKAFHNMVTYDWATVINQYCDLLDTLQESLAHAAGEYEGLLTSYVEPLGID